MDWEVKITWEDMRKPNLRVVRMVVKGRPPCPHCGSDDTELVGDEGFCFVCKKVFHTDPPENLTK